VIASKEDEKMEQQNSEWFKLVDAAQILGVSEITLRRRLKSNQIPHQLRFGKYLILLERSQSTGQWNLPEHVQQFESSQIQLNQLRNHAKLSPTNLSTSNQISQEWTLRLQKCEVEIGQLKRKLADQETLIQFLEQTLNESLAPRK
jgi:hypothetical protein